MSKKVENFKRRTWDLDEYERLAVEREDKERSSKRVELAEEEDHNIVNTEFATLKYADPTAAGPSGSRKAYLDVETRTLDLDSKVGKFEKVEGSRQSGFHCPVCDLYFQDSLSLLDHVNGREHQSRLGYSMVTKRASVNEVKSRLAKHTQNAVSKALSSSSSNAATKSQTSTATFADRVKEIEQQQDSKRNKKSRKKQQAAKEEAEGDGDSLLPSLGFASFGS